ncbi:transferase family protein [Colletotrichum sojae]|uniref:Transferase family protein n=1 Tax=Colletotrichum sojae TaxID=2175907 RepID=A0A8H6MY18_9PEZI|nr:transferase family protein [Colletotrichum sojae]
MGSLPHKHLTLNPLDHFPPSNYTFFCSYLPLKDGVTPDDVVEVLHEGLRRTFKQLPWLSGKVHLQSSSAPGWRPGQLEVRYSEADFDQGVPLRQLSVKHLDPEEVGMSYEDLKESGFPLDVFEDEQLTARELLPRYEDAPDCFSAQANFMDGACLLVVATQHAVCDGTSYFDVWKIFADHCEHLQRPGSPWPDAPLADSVDRTLLDRIWAAEGTGRSTSEAKAESWSLLDLPVPGSPPLEAAESLKTLADTAMQSAVFYVSPEKFAALQRHCAAGVPADTALPISSNDALGALIWRCLSRARRRAALEGKRPAASAGDAKRLAAGEARLFMTVDARPDISPSMMPMLYLGNLFFVNICSAPLAELTAEGAPLGPVAQAIRAVNGRATREALLDAYMLAHECPDLDAIRLHRGHTPGSFDMVLSSLLMFPVEGVRFGGRVFANGGLPDAVRPLMRRFNRASQVCFVLPRKPFGGVEFVCNLYEDEMQLLLEDEEFAAWCMHYSF